eukprot:3571150-Pyramimonas_sp.AAC.1
MRKSLPKVPHLALAVVRRTRRIPHAGSKLRSFGGQVDAAARGRLAEMFLQALQVIWQCPLPWSFVRHSERGFLQT